MTLAPPHARRPTHTCIIRVTVKAGSEDVVYRRLGAQVERFNSIMASYRECSVPHCTASVPSHTAPRVFRPTLHRECSVPHCTASVPSNTVPRVFRPTLHRECSVPHCTASVASHTAPRGFRPTLHREKKVFRPILPARSVLSQDASCTNPYCKSFENINNLPTTIILSLQDISMKENRRRFFPYTCFTQPNLGRITLYIM